MAPGRRYFNFRAVQASSGLKSSGASDEAVSKVPFRCPFAANVYDKPVARLAGLCLAHEDHVPWVTTGLHHVMDDVLFAVEVVGLERVPFHEDDHQCRS